MILKQCNHSQKLHFSRKDLLHLCPVDPQHLLMHIHWPQIACTLCGVWWEVPAASLLVVSHFMDGAPQAFTPYMVNADQCSCSGCVCHIGYSACIQPGWRKIRKNRAKSRGDWWWTLAPLPSQIHLPWEICTSVTKHSLRGNLCGMAARLAMPLMMLSQSAANSSGRSRLQTISDGTVRMMLSNSNSAQGEGAVRSNDQSATVVTPEEKRAILCTSTQKSIWIWVVLNFEYKQKNVFCFFNDWVSWIEKAYECRVIGKSTAHS